MGNAGPQNAAQRYAGPKADPALLVDTTATVAVQVNGKVTRNDHAAPQRGAEEAKLALADANVKRALDGKTPKKVIVVPNKIVNIVV